MTFKRNLTGKCCVACACCVQITFIVHVDYHLTKRKRNKIKDKPCDLYIFKEKNHKKNAKHKSISVQNKIHHDEQWCWK